VGGAEPLTKAIDSITREDRSYESYALREELRRALAAVSPPAPVDEPASIEPQASAEQPTQVEATVDGSLPAEPPLAASRIELPSTASETLSSATPQVEEATAHQPDPAPFIAGITDATDQQLGERLREIAQAAMGGGRPPLDGFDARREAARVIGAELHRRGGRAAMERALDEYVGNSFGRHPVSQAWDGVGEWMG
jgi:hypothetical protein